MEKLLAREPAPDHIVIETSGLALPQPLVRAFNWPEISHPRHRRRRGDRGRRQAVAEGRFAHDEAAVDPSAKPDENLPRDAACRSCSRTRSPAPT
jgi:cobalamin biosynthesis protein CobW